MAPSLTKKHLWIPALASAVIFSVSISFNQAMTWSDWKLGAQAGAIQSIPLAPLWLITGLTPGIVTYFIVKQFRASKTSPYIIFISTLFPSICFIEGPVLSPQTIERRFEATMKVKLPLESINKKAYYSGGLLADIHDYYYFECTSESLVNLINKIGLKPLRKSVKNPLINVPDNIPLSEFKDQALVYTNDHDTSGLWFYVLLTNPEHTKVVIRVLST